MFVKITKSGPRRDGKLAEAYRDRSRTPRQRVITALRRIESVRVRANDSQASCSHPWRPTRTICQAPLLGSIPFPVERHSGPQAEHFGRPTPNPTPRLGRSSPPRDRELATTSRNQPQAPELISVSDAAKSSLHRASPGFAGPRPPLTVPSTRATLRLEVSVRRWR